MSERPKNPQSSTLSFNQRLSKESLLRLLSTPIVKSMIARAAFEVKEERERKAKS